MHDAKEDTECTLCIDKLLPIQNWVKSSNIQKVFAPARLHHVYFTRFFEPRLQCFNLKNDNNNKSSSNRKATKHRTYSTQYTGNRCIIFPHFNSDCSDGWMQWIEHVIRKIDWSVFKFNARILVQLQIFSTIDLLLHFGISHRNLSISVLIRFTNPNFFLNWFHFDACRKTEAVIRLFYSFRFKSIAASERTNKITNEWTNKLKNEYMQTLATFIFELWLHTCVSSTSNTMFDCIFFLLDSFLDLYVISV